VTRTAVLTVSRTNPDAAALHDAAAVLRSGGLVAFPTETFYGLGAAALSGAAVRRVFEVKGRAESKPLLVLVESIAMLARVAASIPPAAEPLMARHWPGPLTLIVPARATIPEVLTAGTGTVGVRVPGHPVARALVAALGEPVTAPSANPSGAPPPTTAAAVVAYFEGSIDVVIDAGPTPGGAPSTVVDVTVDPPRILRRGAVLLDK
jgi:L-threonylcarbamoyladenylate synthase